MTAEHALRSLHGTYDFDMKYHRNVLNSDKPWQWVDADWAGDTDTRRSNIGYVLLMNGGPISWKSQRQDFLTLSTKAHYQA